MRFLDKYAHLRYDKLQITEILIDILLNKRKIVIIVTKSGSQIDLIKKELLIKSKEISDIKILKSSLQKLRFERKTDIINILFIPRNCEFELKTYNRSHFYRQKKWHWIR